MAQYGYKLSGFARSEKFFEAEHYLDRRLKGFTKANATFTDDGSRTQVWQRTAEDGTEQTVTLVKNVTESGVIVFSDIELKELKHGGIIMYLKDIPIQAAFAALYWYGFIKLRSTPVYGILITRAKIAGLVAIIGLVYAAIIGLSTKIISIRRTPARTRWIQTGGPFSIVAILYLLWSWTFKGGGVDFRSFLMNMLYSQIAPFLFAWILILVIRKVMDRK